MQQVKQNFICIGAQKAGTTTLADILAQHSDIYIPEIKETKFFLFDEEYNKGLAYYNETYFSTYNGEKAVGEFDPDYLLFTHTATRIAETLGTGIKIIVVLRNPADRAYSHYLMTRKKGLEDFGFVEALVQEANRKTDLKQHKIFAYLERGCYGEQLQAFMKVFPKENFLILFFEKDVASNMESTINTIQDFLGVKREKLEYAIHSNEAGDMKSETMTKWVRKPNFVKNIFKKIIPVSGGRKAIRKFLIKKNLKPASAPKLDTETRKMVIEKYFKEDILLLQQLTGKDMSYWN